MPDRHEYENVAALQCQLSSQFRLHHRGLGPKRLLGECHRDAPFQQRRCVVQVRPWDVSVRPTELAADGLGRSWGRSARVLL
jgi:hypothetical protein